MVSAEWWNEPSGPPPPDNDAQDTGFESGDTANSAKKPEADSYEATHEDLLAYFNACLEVPAPPAEMYYGPLGRMALAEGAESECDPAALYGTFISGFGNIVSVAPLMGSGPLAGFPVVNCVLVGASAAPRKSSTHALVLDTLGHIDSSWPTRIRTDAASAEYLVEQIRDARTEEILDKRSGKLKTVLIPGVDDKRLMIVYDELVTLWIKHRRQGNVLMSYYRSAYDGKAWRPGAKSNQDRCMRPRVSVCGATTHSDIKKYLPEGFLDDGSANRYLWVLAREMKPNPYADPVPANICKDDISELAKIVARIRSTPGTWQMEWTPEAMALVKGEIYYKARAYRNHVVTSRAETQVLRIAMILALADGKHMIGVEHVNAAWLFWEYCAKCAIAIFGLCKLAEKAERILEFLREKGSRGASRTDIRVKVFQNRIGPQELTIVCDELLKAKLSRKEGKHPERWFAIEPDWDEGPQGEPEPPKDPEPQKTEKPSNFDNDSAAIGSPTEGSEARSEGEKKQKNAIASAINVNVNQSAFFAFNLVQGSTLNHRNIRTGESLGALTFEELVLANSAKMPLALDIETVCPFDISDARYLRTAEPRLVSICNPKTPEVSNVKSPVFLIDFSTLSTQEKAVLRELLSGRDLVVYNGFFDLAILERCLGPFTEASRVFDCMLAATVLDNYAKPTGQSEARGYPSFANVLRDYLDVEISKEEQNSDWGATQLRSEQLNYAAVDAAYLHQLRAKLEARIDAENLRATFDLETALAPITRSIIAGGTGCDLELAKSLYAERAPRVQELTRQAQAELGIKNPASHPQILTVLQRREIKVPVRRKGETTQVLIEDTTKRTLSKIKTELGVQTILELRALTKELEHCKSWIDAYIENGRVFPEYFQIGTVTARYSSKRVILQHSRKRQFGRCSFLTPAVFWSISISSSSRWLRRRSFTGNPHSKPSFAAALTFIKP
jgi:hypothetical protein